jgi:2-polyprenyl-3-methyl-5-hydroxy-6-metoxy-1,4-benzoquinol methylase
MIHCLSGRVLKPEILDTLPLNQARASLADLIRINRHWGGHGTLRKLLRATIDQENFSLLDVGAASGDMGELVRELYPHARVTSLDHLESHLASCPDPRVAGDAFSLPFRPRSFDYVFCSLFLHHFTDQQIIALFKEFGRVSGHSVLVIDLERNPIAYYFIPWTRWIFGWDPITVNDAAISVEAAFKPRELESLARQAGLTGITAKLYRPAFRIAMSAQVSSNDSGYNPEWEDNEQRR